MLARDQTVRDRLDQGVGIYPKPNNDEPCVGPKDRVGRLLIENTLAVLGQRHRSATVLAI